MEYVALAAGGTVEAHMQPLEYGHDSSIYLVTDPDYLEESCVTDADETVGEDEEWFYH